MNNASEFFFFSRSNCCYCVWCKNQASGGAFPMLVDRLLIKIPFLSTSSIYQFNQPCIHPKIRTHSHTREGLLTRMINFSWHIDFELFVHSHFSTDLTWRKFYSHSEIDTLSVPLRILFPHKLQLSRALEHSWLYYKVIELEKSQGER